MPTFKVGYIHSNPPPFLTYVQSACLLTYWGWIYGLTLLALSNNIPHSCLGDLGSDQFHEVVCVCFAPGCPQDRWMVRMRAGSSSPMDAAHTGSVGSASFRSTSSHCWGTLVSGSARFAWDLTSASSVASPYSAANSWSVPSRRLISISDAALVHTLAFSDRVSEIHRCTQAETVRRRIMFALQCSARLTPLNTVSSSARLMCLSASTGRSQLASSIMAPSYSIDTPVARELASTNTVTSWPFAHQSPCAGSVCDDLNIISSSIRRNIGSCVSSSHPIVTAFALRFTNAAATRSQPHTGKCPISRLHAEKTVRRVSTPLRRHLSLPCSSQTYTPNTRAPLLSSGSLQVSPNSSRCVFTWAAEHSLSLTNMSSTYEEVAPLTVSSCPITTDRMICGATFSPNSKRVRQYLCPLIFTVWNGHSDLSMWICRYARRRSTISTIAIPSWFERTRPHSPYKDSHAHSAHDSPLLAGPSVYFPVVWPLTVLGL